MRVSRLQGIDNVVKVLKRGGLMAYPTDTAYGLGASAKSLIGVKKVFTIKDRQKQKAVAVVVASFKQAKEIGLFNQKALKLWRKFMPGALTLLVPLTTSARRRQVWQILTGGSNVIGIRMPAHPLPLKIVRALGAPLTTTSANVSGQPTAYSAEEVVAQFSRRRHKPDIVIDGGHLKPGQISTVVDCTGPEIKIVRQGSISAKQIFTQTKNSKRKS